MPRTDKNNVTIYEHKQIATVERDGWIAQVCEGECCPMDTPGWIAVEVRPGLWLRLLRKEFMEKPQENIRKKQTRKKQTLSGFIRDAALEKAKAVLLCL